MMMQSNPVAMLVQAAQRGGNPVQIMQQMAGQVPEVQQALRLINGKSPRQVRQVAENMARERGIDLTDMAQQLGFDLR